MSLTVIRTAPSPDNYTPLDQYQSTTPETFFGGKPVLHAHLIGAKAWLHEDDRASLATLFPSDSPSAEGQDSTLEQGVDIFVGSDYLTLFNHSTDSGLQIPYPSIALHAVKTVSLPPSSSSVGAIYMQLELSASTEDDEISCTELTLVPTPTSAVTADALFKAISNCSNLHPSNGSDADTDASDDDRIVFESSVEATAIEGYAGVFSGATDGGLPPPMPGSGGWITADNVHEFFDKDGNWIGGDEEEEEEEDDDDEEVAEELGEGAGRVRVRAEVEAEEAKEMQQNGVNRGEGTDTDGESKRLRVE